MAFVFSSSSGSCGSNGSSGGDSTRGEWPSALAAAASAPVAEAAAAAAARRQRQKGLGIRRCRPEPPHGAVQPRQHSACGGRRRWHPQLCSPVGFSQDAHMSCTKGCSLPQQCTRLVLVIASMNTDNSTASSLPLSYPLVALCHASPSTCVRPQPLPDALRGEKWAFVQLPLGPLLDMLNKVDEVRRTRHAAAWNSCV